MIRRLTTLVAGVGLSLALAACGEHPPMETSQSGYRGTGMVQVNNPRLEAYLAKQLGEVPAPPYDLPPDEGPRAGEVYQNVQVLKDISADRFNRLMLAITEWVVPQAYRDSEESAGGCNYCHNPANLASDEIYTKVVARRMLQMTANINTTWGPHVGVTGATCYTCHRGQPVPAAVWTPQPDEFNDSPVVASMFGQNDPDEAVAYSSLPYDPYSPYLVGDQNIRVQGTTRFPISGREDATIRDTEQTYGLMMHMSKGLGVNCTFCHNSRAFASWLESNVQRTTAWHGIRMVRETNAGYIYPLQEVWAANQANWSAYGPPRLGPLGAPLMVNCTTCHRGQNKPLDGVSQMADFPSLALLSSWPPASRQTAALAPAEAAMAADPSTAAPPAAE